MYRCQAQYFTTMYLSKLSSYQLFYLYASRYVGTSNISLGADAKINHSRVV